MEEHRPVGTDTPARPASLDDIHNDLVKLNASVQDICSELHAGVEEMKKIRRKLVKEQKKKFAKQMTIWLNFRNFYYILYFLLL
jgi:hypothetical protein